MPTPKGLLENNKLKLCVELRARSAVGKFAVVEHYHISSKIAFANRRVGICLMLKWQPRSLTWEDLISNDDYVGIFDDEEQILDR